MRIVGTALAATLVSGTVLVACSSGQGPSTIDAKKTFSSLTTEERHQYCEDHGHYMSSHVSTQDRQKIGCSDAARSAGSVWSGSDMEKAQSQCDDVFKTCMKGTPAEAQVSCAAFGPEADDCAATVGDGNDCAEAQADALGKLVSKADDACKNLGKTEEKTEEQSPKMQACTRLKATCPKLFDKLFAEPALGTGTAATPAATPPAATPAK